MIPFNYFGSLPLDSCSSRVGAFLSFSESKTIKNSVLLYLSGNLKETNLIIYLSSIAVYGRSEIPNSEASPLMPINEYGRAKVHFERYLLENTVASPCILRISNVFGRLEFDDVINRMPKTYLNNHPLILTEPEKVSRDFIFIDSIFDVISQILTDSSTRKFRCILNVGSGKSMFLSEILQLIESTLNTQLEFERIPLKKEVIPTSLVSTVKLKKVTNVKITDPISNLREYINSVKVQLN